MSRRFDAVVVGSGPAGATAVYVLASAGRSVALLEAKPFPRYKACGGGVVGRALAALPCRRPTESDIPLFPVHRVAVHGGEAEAIVVERSSPPVTMVMRADFDAYLADRAAEAGAQRFEGAAVREVGREDGELVCRTVRDEYRARAVIGADGAESRIAALVPGGHGAGAARLGPALEGELSLRKGTGPISEGGPVTRFDFAAAPGGYGWVFPKGDHVSAGVFSSRPPCPSFRSFYRGYLERAGLGSENAAEDRLSGHRIPIRPRRTVAHGGLLLAGDAAGLADPLTGEGISFAIRSGVLAAEAVLLAAAAPDRAGRIYTGLLGRSLLPEIRAARLLSAIVYRAPLLAYRYFRRRPHLAEAVVDVFLGRRSYPELLTRALTHPWRLLLP